MHTATRSDPRQPGGNDVIATPATLFATRAQRFAAATAIAWFALLLFGTALVDAVAPVPRPELIGAEAATAERARAAARFADGTLARQVELVQRESSRVRRYALAAYVPLLYRAFGVVRDTQLLGSDGFVFLRNRLAPGGRDQGEHVRAIASS
jgi:hypothetical protein